MPNLQEDPAIYREVQDLPSASVVKEQSREELKQHTLADAEFAARRTVPEVLREGLGSENSRADYEIGPEVTPPRNRTPQGVVAPGQAPARGRHVQKREWIGDAMRAEGLDERKVAETYAGVLDSLTARQDSAGIEKLLVDVLKECSRLLEPPRAAEADKSTHVRLVHRVARPKRVKAPQGS